MGLFRWRGNGAGTKTAWADGRNWIDENGDAYLQARYPGSDAATYDDVLFDAAITNSPAGYNAVTAGDEVLLSLKVGELYNGTIASTGTHLKVDVSATGNEVMLAAKAAGDIYIDGAGTGLEVVRVSNTKSSSMIYLGGTIGSLAITRGNVTLQADAEVSTHLICSYHDSRISDTKLTIPAAATVTPTDGFVVNGGSITCAADINTVVMSDGRFTMTGGTTTLHLFGGEFVWNEGTITTAWLHSGSLDASQSATARTATKLFAFAESTFDLENGLRNISIGEFWEYQGGDFRWDRGQRFTDLTPVAQEASATITSTTPGFYAQTHGPELEAGTLVHIIGEVDGTPIITVSRADVPSTTPAVAYVASDIAVNGGGNVYFNYRHTGRSGLDVGKGLFVGTDGKPAQEGDANFPATGDILQRIGFASASTIANINIDSNTIVRS